MLSLKEFKGSEFYDLNNLIGGKELSSYTRSNGEIIAKDVSDCTDVHNEWEWDNTTWLTSEDPTWNDYHV